MRRGVNFHRNISYYFDHICATGEEFKLYALHEMSNGVFNSEFDDIIS